MRVTRFVLENRREKNVGNHDKEKSKSNQRNSNATREISFQRDARIVIE